MTATNENLPFAAVSVEQARNLVREVVAQELRSILCELPERPRDAMNAKEAVAYLAEIGYPIGIGTLYNTSAGRGSELPHKKVGKRLVFSRKDLASWVDEKTTERGTRSDAALTLSASARRKK